MARHAEREAAGVRSAATDLNRIPVGDVDSTLVRHGNPSNVDTVIANGRVLKRGGELIGIDVKALRRSASASLHRLRERAGGQWKPPPGGPRF